MIGDPPPGDWPDPQDWWHDEPADRAVDPHAGLSFLRMARWVLGLIALHETWFAIRNWRKK